ncbi:conserved hypothetical protein, membrane [Candidatus Omnitrophus magneticus]|uniref:Glycosyltransferase RgtA/B/C/D-like domain-containing protein n=1 Tax=Candidatus Omnitrophus magneticus TaxID=1609969 RepID=A0A0F0CQE3_9BACT|nr:conserved hypothetical protein, membrane [Candidatus Omnitrophus magneticus]
MVINLIKNKIVVVFFIIALALTLRLILAFALHPNEMGWSDGNRYLRYALQLIETGKFEKHLTAEPFYPAVWALVYAVFGKSLLYVRIFMAVIGTILCFIIYKIGTRIFSEKAGITALVLSALYPIFIYLSRTCEYPTHFFTFLLALLVLSMISVIDDPSSIFKWIVSGFILGISILTVPTLFTFAPFMALWLFITTGLSIIRRFVRVVLFTLVSIIPILIFTMLWYEWHNELRVYPFNTSRSGGAFFLGNSELNYVYGDTGFYENFKENDPRLEQYQIVKKHLEIQNQSRNIEDPAERAKFLKDHAKQWIKDNPKKFAELFFRKFIGYWQAFVTPTIPNPDDSPAKRFVQALTYFPILFLSILGVWLSRKKWKYTVPILLLIGTQCLTYTLYLTRVRYRTHIDSFLIIFAALAICVIFEKLSSKINKKEEAKV